MVLKSGKVNYTGKMVLKEVNYLGIQLKQQQLLKVYFSLGGFGGPERTEVVCLLCAADGGV